LDPAVTRAAHAEIERLLGEAGVGTEWATAGPNVGRAALAVVVLKADARRFHLQAEVMGLSRPGGRGAWILYPAVESTLRHGAPRRETLCAELRGRALGRVVAHEVVHALALSHAHSERGLMRERLGRHALLAPNIEWDSASREALRAALARTPDVAVAPDAAVAVLGSGEDGAPPRPSPHTEAWGQEDFHED
jgi:hypothetical protein